MVFWLLGNAGPTRRTLVAALGGLLMLVPPPAPGEELLPPDRPIEEVIDYHIDAVLRRDQVPAAPLADDATILRRTMLDLVGRPPTPQETRAYLADSGSDKRVRLVERLIGTPAYVRHQALEFDTMLMDGANGSLRQYLETALRDGVGWDQMFRDMLLHDGEATSDASPGRFVLTRVSDLDKLANDTSILFFGVNVSCAQCHDHPIVPDWTQDHFFGMKSFFSRTFENGGFVAERDYGDVKYKTTEGESRDARLMFLTGTIVDEPAWEPPTDQQQKEEKQRLEELKKKKQAPPPPAFSRRAQLVEVALRPDQRHFFAKSIVNRLWYRFHGHGLVMPVDQMHPENPPTHPELLEWLARDLIAHNYDLSRLIRGLTLSRTYARSSQLPSGDPPSADYFAVGRLRALTPMQYAVTLRLAATNPDQFAADLDAQELQKRLDQIHNAARGLASEFEQPRQDFQIGVSEALLLSNSERVEKELLRDSSDSLVGKLKQLQEPSEQVATAFWNVLGREPSDEEQKLLQGFLAERRDRTDEGLKQLVWALLGSSPCRFNY